MKLNTELFKEPDAKNIPLLASHLDLEYLPRTRLSFDENHDQIKQMTDFQNTPYIYNGLCLEKIPAIFPYNPSEINNTNDQYEFGMAAFPITMKLPIHSVSLPNTISPDNLEFFLNVQNMPWNINPHTPQDEQLLLRPHPWLHQDAPREGAYNKVTLVQYAIFKNITDPHQFKELRCQTHKEDLSNYVVYSPNAAQVHDLVNNTNQTTSFYSLIQYPNRKALTLHWLLNQEDYFKLKNLINQNQIKTLKGVIAFANSLENQTTLTINPIIHFQNLATSSNTQQIAAPTTAAKDSRMIAAALTASATIYHKEQATINMLIDILKHTSAQAKISQIIEQLNPDLQLKPIVKQLRNDNDIDTLVKIYNSKIGFALQCIHHEAPNIITYINQQNLNKYVLSRGR